MQADCCQRQRRVQTCERRRCLRSGLLGLPAFRPFASPRPRPTLKQKPPLWCNRIRRNVCDLGGSSSVHVVFVLGTDLFGPRSPSLPDRLWNPIFDFFAILNSGQFQFGKFSREAKAGQSPARVFGMQFEIPKKSKNRIPGLVRSGPALVIWVKSGGTSARFLIFSGFRIHLDPIWKVFQERPGQTSADF